MISILPMPDPKPDGAVLIRLLLQHETVDLEFQADVHADRDVKFALGHKNHISFQKLVSTHHPMASECRVGVS